MNRSTAMRSLLHALLVTALFTAGTTRAQIPPSTVRAIHGAGSPSVLPLTGTLKVKGRDLRIEGSATVVDRSGLMLTTLLATRQPMDAAEARRSALFVRLDSGPVLPVRVVLTDPDTRAVVLAPENRPRALDHAFTPVPWGPSVPGRPMDHVVTIARFPATCGGIPVSTPARINAVARNPGLLYVCAGLAGGHAEPAFDRDGRLLGFVMGPGTIVAAGELKDLVDQARRQTPSPPAKAVRP